MAFGTAPDFWLCISTLTREASYIMLITEWTTPITMPGLVARRTASKAANAATTASPMRAGAETRYVAAICNDMAFPYGSAKASPPRDAECAVPAAVVGLVQQ